MSLSDFFSMIAPRPPAPQFQNDTHMMFCKQVCELSIRAKSCIELPLFMISPPIKTQRDSSPIKVYNVVKGLNPVKLLLPLTVNLVIAYDKKPCCPNMTYVGCTNV